MDRVTPEPVAVAPATAAAMLGIGRSRFYELLHDGEIKSFRLGRRRLIRVSELHALIERLAAQERAA